MCLLLAIGQLFFLRSVRPFAVIQAYSAITLIEVVLRRIEEHIPYRAVCENFRVAWRRPVCSGAQYSFDGTYGKGP